MIFLFTIVKAKNRIDTSKVITLFSTVMSKSPPTGQSPYSCPHPPNGKSNDRNMYLKIWLDILVQISALEELWLKLTGVLGNLRNKMDRCIRRSSLNAGTILARVNSTLHPSGADKMSTCHNGCFVKPWQIQKNEFRHRGWNFVIT